MSSLTDPRCPNFFILGAPKAGTTLLHNALGKAPPVYMSPVKEPGLFASGSIDLAQVHEYAAAFFRGAEPYPIRGESTPWYLYSDEAPSLIARWCGEETRFLVVLRAPASRSYSHFRDQCLVGREGRTFEEAVIEERRGLEREELFADSRRRYVWTSMYSPHIRRWQAEWGADRLLVLISEELVDPHAAWHSIGSHLGLALGPEHISAASATDRHVAGALRVPRLDHFIRSLEGSASPFVQLGKHIAPSGALRRLLQTIYRLNRRAAPPAPLPTAVLDDLDRSFRDEVAAVEGLLGRPIPAWRRAAVAGG